MHRIFSKSDSNVRRGGAQPVISQTMNRMKSQSDLMEQKIADCNSELRTMKTALNRTRSPAAKSQIKRSMVYVAQRRKMYMRRYDSLRTQQVNFEAANFSIDDVKNAAFQSAALRSARDEMKTQLKELDINEVDELQEQMEELMGDTSEVVDVSSRSIVTPHLYVDEDDLDDLLDEIGDDEEETDEVYEEEYEEDNDTIPIVSSFRTSPRANSRDQPSSSHAVSVSSSQSNINSLLTAIDDYGLPSLHKQQPLAVDNNRQRRNTGRRVPTSINNF
jgi:charged multivesicular body protein 5